MKPTIMEYNTMREYCEILFRLTNNRSGSKFLVEQGWKPLYRINKSQAWVWTHEEKETQMILSYDTIVAIYEPYYDLIISLGRYSHTTYSHIRKFKENYSIGGKDCEEINLELCNWFK